MGLYETQMLGTSYMPELGCDFAKTEVKEEEQQNHRL
jgi:hypothetical protein